MRNCWRYTPLVGLGCLLLGTVFLYSKDLREGTQPGKNIQIQEILNQVQEVAANIEDKKKRGSILSHLARLQARTGNAAIALATASTIPNDWQREHALMLIGWGQTEIGDTKGARKTATLIKNDSLRNQALAHLARWQAAAGEVDDALDTAHAVTNPARRSAVLASIALVRALRGDWVSADNYFEQAVQAAATVQNDSTKIRALIEIAELQVLARNRIGAARTLDQAEAALAEMGSNAVGDSLRAELAQIQAKAGLVGEAFRTKHEITEERMQRRALGSIAKTQAEAGDLDTAKITINAIPDSSDKDDFDRTFALSVVALEYSNAVAFDKALETVSRMPPGHFLRAHTLASIASAQAWRQDTTNAKETFRQALEEAGIVEDQGMRAQAMRIVAVSLAATGNTAEALQTAEKIQIEHERVNAFSGIAGKQAWRGDTLGALGWIATLNSPQLRAATLLAVADANLQRLERQKARSRKDMR